MLKKTPTWLSELKFTEDNGYHTPNKPLLNKAVVVLGGGPSLTMAVAEALSDHNLILTNNAYTLVRNPTILVALDRRYFDWHGQAILGGGHTIVTSMRPEQFPNLPPNTYFRMKKDREATLPEPPDTLGGTNSGHAAVCLAVHLGATRIYTAGFDMGFRDGKTHWHTGHKVPASEANYVTRFRPKFEKLVKIAEKRGIEVATVTPSWAAIPQVSVDEALLNLEKFG